MNVCLQNYNKDKKLVTKNVKNVHKFYIKITSINYKINKALLELEIAYKNNSM